MDEMTFINLSKEAFPDLTGTKKQVTWGNTIRLDFTDSLVGWLGQMWDAASKGKATEEQVQWLRSAAVQEIASHTDARWWIDNRDNLAATYWTNQWKEQVFAKASKTFARKQAQA